MRNLIQAGNQLRLVNLRVVGELELATVDLSNPAHERFIDDLVGNGFFDAGSVKGDGFSELEQIVMGFWRTINNGDGLGSGFAIPTTPSHCQLS